MKNVDISYLFLNLAITTIFGIFFIKKLFFALNS